MPNLFRNALNTTTHHISPHNIAWQLIGQRNDKRPFGTSSALAARYRFVERHELNKALVQFSLDTGIEDPPSIDEMGNNRVLYTSLADFWDKRKFFAPNPERDAVGCAAAAFMAAEALPLLFDFDFAMSNKPIDVPLVETAMQRAADGLYEVGRDQFGALAQMAVDLVDWLIRDGRKKIVLIEAPLGNSVPVAVVQRLASARGLTLEVVEWGCPRNDRALQGRTVTDSAKDLVSEPLVRNADLVLFMDDAITGSRFLKMAKALRKATGANRFAAVAMRVRFNQAAGFETGQIRDLGIVDGWAAECGMPFGEITFPDMPLFRLDEQAPALIASALAWGDAALTAGKRKNNLVFYFIDRFAAIAKQLSAPGQSEARDLLTQRLWQQDTSGCQLIILPEIAEATFKALFDPLPDDFFDRIHAAAKTAFPDDFYGRRISGHDAMRVRSDWLSQCVFREALRFLPGPEAQCLSNAIQTLSHAGFTAGLDKPPRDHAYGLYTLPLPPGEDLLHKRLIERIVADATTRAPRPAT